MSWIGDRTITYKFQCDICGNTMTHEAKAKDREQVSEMKLKCHCGNLAEYGGFVAEETSGGLIRTPFEHNGVKGYKFKSSKGTSYMSASKLNWIENAKIEPSYTPEFTKHLKDSGQEYMLHSDTSAGKGKAALHKENTGENKRN